MKPYYEDTTAGIKIYHGDAVDVCRQLPAASVDLILTDPPYGIVYQDKNQEVMIGDYGHCLGLVLPSLWNVLTRDGAIYVFTSFKQLADWLYRFQSHFKMNNLLIWEKERSSGMYMGANYGYSYEMIFYGSKGFHKLRGPEDDVLGHRRVSARLRTHPTEKPLDLLKRMIGLSSDPLDCILDCFAGSGSTLEAAKQLGRKAIGVEINEQYCEIAANRLSRQVLNFEAVA